MVAFAVLGLGLLLCAAALTVRHFDAPTQENARRWVRLQNLGAGILAAGALLLLRYTR